MVWTVKTCCQKRKSCDKMGVGLGHNAEATKKRNKTHNATTYVNICNYSTPDIVRISKETTIYCEMVYIKY